MAMHRVAPQQPLVLQLAGPTHPSSSRSLGCPAEPGCLWYRKAPFPSATLSCLHCKLSISLSENGLTASVSDILFPVEIIVTTLSVQACWGLSLHDVQPGGQFQANLMNEDLEVAQWWNKESLLILSYPFRL